MRSATYNFRSSSLSFFSYFFASISPNNRVQSSIKILFSSLKFSIVCWFNSMWYSRSRIVSSLNLFLDLASSWAVLDSDTMAWHLSMNNLMSRFKASTLASRFSVNYCIASFNWRSDSTCIIAWIAWADSTGWKVVPLKSLLSSLKCTLDCTFYVSSSYYYFFSCPFLSIRYWII